MEIAAYKTCHPLGGRSHNQVAFLPEKVTFRSLHKGHTNARRIAEGFLLADNFGRRGYCEYVMYVTGRGKNLRKISFRKIASKRSNARTKHPNSARSSN